jgi:hypothetical protein
VNRFLTRQELSAVLRTGGHSLWTPGPEEPPVDVSPPAKDYLTIALEPDGTLKPAYRDLYFVCMKDPTEGPKIASDPAFAVTGDVQNSDFALGPARWLFRRLNRFARIWLWPVGGFRGAGGLGFLLGSSVSGRIDSAPVLGRWFMDQKPDPGTAAIGLNLKEPMDAAAFWEAVRLVGADGYDIYVADEAGREVYLMHHHDKVVVSIPDPDVFDDVLAELDGLSDVFKDWSGYRCEWDEEDFAAPGGRQVVSLRALASGAA